MRSSNLNSAILELKRENRGESEIIGVLLILFIMMLTISSILSYSTPLLDNMQSGIVMRNSIPQMVQLRDQTLLVTSGIIHSSSMMFSSSKGSLGMDSNTFDIRIDVSGVPAYQKSAILRNIEFTHYESRIAVENGGVWKDSPGGATIMVEPPKIRTSGGNVTIALIEFQGKSSAAGSGLITTEFKLKSKTTYKFENGGYISIKIDSNYQDGWMRYLQHEGFNVVSNTADMNFERLILTEYVIDVEMSV